MELEPADLQPIHKLYKEGKFPSDMNLRYILEGLCTPGRILCVKIRGQWNTTEAAIRAWIANNANLAFKEDVRRRRKIKKRKRPEPRPYPHSPYSKWMVTVPRDYTGKGSQRIYFRTEEEAQRYCDRLSVQNYSTLDPHIDPTKEDPSRRLLGDCANEWVSRHKEHRPTFFQVRQVMTPLIARFGREAIDTVGVQELDGWFRCLALRYSPETMHNYWRRTRHFFNHYHGFGFIGRNPFSILKEPVSRDKRKRHILKPEQMAKCLEAAKGNRSLMAYLCLGGFAGIRTGEILALDWDDLFWEENQIRVRKAKDVENADAKEVWLSDEDDEDEEISGDRMVTMEPVFHRRLERVALKDKEIDAAEQRRSDGGRGSRKIVPGGQRTLYKLRAKLREVLGVKEWPDNCLRHSYKSYHIAFYENLELTRFQMGHSHSNTTKYKYGAARFKSRAQEWWAL